MGWDGGVTFEPETGTIRKSQQGKMWGIAGAKGLGAGLSLMNWKNNKEVGAAAVV